jgi:hypothetical protein
MPTHIELAAKAAYEKFNENLIGCCEPTWEETDESFKLRMVESLVAALLFLREPVEIQYDALCATEKLWREQNSYGVWTTYIDALVKNA